MHQSVEGIGRQMTARHNPYLLENKDKERDDGNGR